MGTMENLRVDLASLRHVESSLAGHKPGDDRYLAFALATLRAGLGAAADMWTSVAALDEAAEAAGWRTRQAMERTAQLADALRCAAEAYDAADDRAAARAMGVRDRVMAPTPW